MSEQERSDTENDARALLLERLDAIMAAVAAGSYDPARQALFVGKWAQEIDEDDLPAGLVARAVALTDAAHAALSRWPPDTEGARIHLEGARELIV